jgi:hypothetical protein
MSDYDLTEREKRHILENSIERVINTSMRIVKKSTDEDVFVNLDDWKALKQLVVKLWDRERNQIFKEMQGWQK